MTEAELAEKYAQKFNYIPIKLDGFGDFDYIMSRDGKVIQWLEIKEREYNKADFVDTMVPIRKVRKALEIIYTGGNAFLLIKWRDVTGILNFVTPFSKIALGGRSDRGFSEYKQYAYYSIKDFTEVEL